MQVLQIELGPQVPEAIAALGEVPIVGAGRQPGEVELHAEMQGPVAGKTFQQVTDLEQRTLGIQGDTLGDSNRSVSDSAFTRHLGLNSVRTASQSSLVGSGQEITLLLHRAAYKLFQRRVVVEKVVQQRLAWLGVVLHALFEPFLFEDDSVMNAGDIAVLGVLSGEHFPVIGFGTPRECRLKVVADTADIELVELSALAGSEQADELFVA